MTRYIDGKGNSWGGHFSTRLELKQRIRELGAMVHNANAVNALATIKADKAIEPNGDDSGNPSQAHIDDHKHAILARHRRISEGNKRLAILQHHDAITGTCSKEVAEEYRYIANEGIKATGAGAVSAMRSLGLLGRDDESVEEVVMLGGGPGGTRGFNKLALGSFMGKYGAAEIVVFNGMAGGGEGTRRVEGYAPCGIGLTGHYIDRGSSGGFPIDVFVGANVVRKEGGGLKVEGEEGRMGVCKFFMNVEVGKLGGRRILMESTKKVEESEQEVITDGLDGQVNAYITSGMVREHLAKSGKNKFGFKLTSSREGEGAGKGVETLVVFELIDKISDLYKVSVTFNGAAPENENVGTRATIRYFPNFPNLYTFTSTAPPGAYVSKYYGAALWWLWVNAAVAFSVGAVVAVAVGRLGRIKRGEHQANKVKEEKNKKERQSVRSVVKRAVFAVVVAVLLGAQTSHLLNVGSLDIFLKPTTTNSGKSKGAPTAGHIGAAGNAENLKPDAQHVTLPGVMVIREAIATLGFVLQRWSGPSVTSVFLPFLFLGSSLHTLWSPLLQSRELHMKLPEDEGVKLAVLNEGKGGISTASIDMGDGIVLSVDKYGVSGFSSFDEVALSVKVNGFMDREYLLDLEDVKRDEGGDRWEGVRGRWGGGLVLDDGVSTFRHRYDYLKSAQQNLVPFTHAIGREGGTGAVYSAMQPVAAVEVGGARLQFMVSRSGEGDDENGLEEGIGREEDLEVAFKAWFGVGGAKMGPRGIRGAVDEGTR